MNSCFKLSACPIVHFNFVAYYIATYSSPPLGVSFATELLEAEDDFASLVSSDEVDFSSSEI